MTFRPTLRPGALLLRRDATHLQVGTSPGIVLADRPGLFALLRLLDGSRDLDRLSSLARERVPELADPLGPLLTELLALGAVVDASRLHPGRRRRAGYRLGLDRGPGSASLATTTTAILATAGLACVDATDPDLLVVTSCGESPRAVLERAGMLRIDHLPVVIDEDRVRIGPLVVPGRTPCISCLDQHRTDWDPAWPALLHQVGRPPTSRIPSVEPLALHAAALEIAAEVLAHLDGRPTRTVGRCLVVGPRHDERHDWPVAFHPSCPCDVLNAA